MGDEELSDSVSYMVEYFFNHYLRPMTLEMIIKYNKLMKTWDEETEETEDKDEDSHEI